MIKVVFLLSFLFSNFALAAADFVELNSGTYTYSEGDRLVLIASTRVNPTDVSSEIVLEATFNDVPIRMINFGGTEAGAVTDPITSPGTYLWSVKAFLQDKNFARSIELGVIKAEMKIVDLQNQFDEESSIDKKALISAAITALEGEIASLQNALIAHRKEVQQKDLEVTVDGISVKSVVPPLLTISTSNDANQFEFGERIEVFFDIAEGTEGSTKNQVFAHVNHNDRAVEKISENRFKLVLSANDIQIGSILIGADFKYRNRWSSDSILDAIGSSSVRIGELYGLIASSMDPALAAYYQKERDDVMLIRSAFYHVHTLLEKSGEFQAAYLTVTESSEEYKSVSVGSNFTCAIFRSGVHCWGVNGSGQLGVGDLTNRLSPDSYAVGLESGVRGLTAGFKHACAIKDGYPYCWGDNDFGQLGISSTFDESSPQLVYSMGGVEQVSAGGGHTCGIAHGKLYCWGSNSNGQLGQSITGDVSYPVEVPLPDVVSVSAGQNFTCALNISGDVYCWGFGLYGQLGNGSISLNSPYPTKVLNLVGATQISAGKDTACALAQGAVKCWGSNSNGELGASFVGSNSSVPVDVDGLESGVSIVDLGSESVCVIQSGIGKCWGRATNGALGNGLATGVYASPITVTGLSSDVFGISAGDKFGCAVQVGDLKCWGSNYGGNLGNGTSSGVHSLVPGIVSPPPLVLRK